ncbi:ABC transporter permease [Streptomyces formicae]|uniref:Sugar ABC transporter permease n=1 Tax=Streptomyces formicae TaxID=1616117 RepID=A0ABY3WHX9_9ACTN|nr:ABC transporter permease subunit [Streptomyces formicae]UNM12183.1 sugar ABC transporter permease [Streptomyces formicae]
MASAPASPRLASSPPEATPDATAAPTGRNRTGPKRTGPNRKPLRHRLRRDRTLLLLCVPGILYFAVFFYLPLAGNVIAFQDYQPYLGFQQSPFVGWSNFTALLAEPEFWSAVWNTLEISAVQLVLYFPAPLALALFLNSLISNKTRRLMQTVVYLPHFLSWVVVVGMFQQVFGGAGTVSSYLNDHGVHVGNIMNNPDTFIFLITSQAIWKDAGWGAIIFLAAMASIDNSLYESAAMDGAGWLRRMWHITLPGIRPVMIMLLILRLGDILSVGFEQLLLQRDAVGTGAAEVIDTYVYFHGVVDGDWGMSTAAGLMKGVIGFVLIVLANKLAHRLGEQGVYR